MNQNVVNNMFQEKCDKIHYRDELVYFPVEKLVINSLAEEARFFPKTP